MHVNELPEWRELRGHAERTEKIDIAELFETDPARLDYLTLEAAGIYLDVSKQRLDGGAFEALLDLAAKRDLDAARASLFSGEIVNPTENRPALHTLLREATSLYSDDAHLARKSDIERTLSSMARFCARLEHGALKGATGERIRNVVNIGIGGSHLGPKMVCDALRNVHREEVQVHFVSNVDEAELLAVLSRLEPASTFFIVASKSFTTTETLLNANSARKWLTANLRDSVSLSDHFAAVTAMPDRAIEFGIAPQNIFPMWDWVGGRYSLWSAIGLPIAASIGYDHFVELLAGAHAMDRHFFETDPHENLPIVLGLIGIWNNNFLKFPSMAVVPYDDRLASLPAYLQQLEMESNGKQVSQQNAFVTYHTAPAIWGGVGTNAQHAFFQQFHQGTYTTPIDFIMVCKNEKSSAVHQNCLVANCIAQAEGLMNGRTAAQLEDEQAKFKGLATHRASPGNRPSTTIALDRLTPKTLGALLALYEHKTFVQGVIWDINSFDQWGVELGKMLAQTIEAEIKANAPGEHDPSTRALIARYLATD